MVITERHNLAHRIRSRLEDEINEGVLLPGDNLDERQLAERFQVSRTPVREAIQQLAAHGLVRVIPRQGVYVARMSIQELLAMFELLAELEGICAKYAARRMNPDQLKRLMEIHKRSEAAVELGPTSYAQENADFHEVIYEGSHNRYLVDQVRFIRKRTEIFRQNTFQRESRPAESLAEHGKVIEAILAGNAEAAYKAMRDHISVGGTGFAEFVSTLPEHMFETHQEAYPPPRRGAFGRAHAAAVSPK